MTQTEKVDILAGAIVTTFVDTFLQFELNGIYFTIYAINNFMNLLAEIVEECQFRILTETISEIATSEGIAALITRLALNFTKFNDTLEEALSDFALGFYKSSG